MDNSSEDKHIVMPKTKEYPVNEVEFLVVNPNLFPNNINATHPTDASTQIDKYKQSKYQARHDITRYQPGSPQLYVYSLRFYRYSWDIVEKRYTEHIDIRSAFGAFLKSGELKLFDVWCFTDYEHLWCTTQLPLQMGEPFLPVVWNRPKHEGLILALRLDIDYVEAQNISRIPGDLLEKGVRALEILREKCG